MCEVGTAYYERLVISVIEQISFGVMTLFLNDAQFDIFKLQQELHRAGLAKGEIVRNHNGSLDVLVLKFQQRLQNGLYSAACNKSHVEPETFTVF